MDTNKTTTGFFEEAPGVQSEMRLKSFILLIFYIAYHLPFGWANAKSVSAGVPMISPSDNQLYFDLIVLCFVFIPKAAQKVIEVYFGGRVKQ